MAQSKLVATPWLSKNTPSAPKKSKVQSMRHTARPNDEKIKPVWLESLRCQESFVHRVPTLGSIACASILENNKFKNFDKVEKFIWNKMANEKVDVVATYECLCDSEFQCLHRKNGLEYCNIQNGVRIANELTQDKYLGFVEFAIPYAPYDITWKNLAKDFSHEQAFQTYRSRREPSYIQRNNAKRRLSFSD